MAQQQLIPVIATVPRYRFDPDDRIRIAGVEYRYAETNDFGHAFARADDPRLTETFTHEDIHRLVGSQSFQHDRKWYAGGSARARLYAGVASLHEIPNHEQSKILWKFEFCVRFIALEGQFIAPKESNEKVSRSDKSMKRAIAKINEAVVELDIAKVTKRAGQAVLIRKRPGPKSLRDWLRRLEDANFEPLALRDSYRKCGNRNARLDPEEYATMMRCAASYADERRPTKKSVYNDMLIEFSKVNASRREKGLPELTPPSKNTLYTAINGLNKFAVYAARHGLEAAKKKFKIVGAGLSDVVRPLQRVEMDEWSVQLHKLLIDAGAWEQLPEELRARVARVRKVLCVAICVATKCIVGMRLADEASAENAIATLEMAVSDKALYADAVGALSPWDMHGTMETVVTDMGGSFIKDEFRAIVVDLKATVLTPPAGLPYLRGTIERVFRTIHVQLASMFTGRTFEHVVARGDYPSKQRSSITVDESAWACVRYVVDRYHNTPHEALAGETPRAAWLRLTKLFGVSPPPDKNKRRHLFAVAITRTITNRGVRVLGIHYQSLELQEYFRQVGGIQVEVRVDHRDMGEISVKLDSGWLTVPAPNEAFINLDADTWIEAMKDLRRRNAKIAELTYPIVQSAISAIRELADNGARRANIGDTRPTSRQIELAERDVALGFVIGDIVDPAAARPNAQQDLYDGAIDVVGNDTQTTNPSETKTNDSKGGKTWSIED